MVYFNFFNLKSKLHWLHLLLLRLLVGDVGGFLEQPTEHLLEQLLHPGAGVPGEFLCSLSGSAHLYGASAGTEL